MNRNFAQISSAASLAVILSTFGWLAGVPSALADGGFSWVTVPQQRVLAENTTLCALNICFEIEAGPITVFREKYGLPEMLASGRLAHDTEFAGLIVPRGSLFHMGHPLESRFSFGFSVKGLLALPGLNTNIYAGELSLFGISINRSEQKFSLNETISFSAGLLDESSIQNYVAAKGSNFNFYIRQSTGQTKIRTLTLGKPKVLGIIPHLNLTLTANRGDQLSFDESQKGLRSIHFKTPLILPSGIELYIATFASGLVLEAGIPSDQTHYVNGVEVQRSWVFFQNGAPVYAEPKFDVYQSISGILNTSDHRALGNGILFHENGKVLRMKTRLIDENKAYLPTNEQVSQDYGRNVSIGEAAYLFDEQGHPIAIYLLDTSLHDHFYSVSRNVDNNLIFTRQPAPTGPLRGAFDLDAISDSRPEILNARRAALDFVFENGK